MNLLWEEKLVWGCIWRGLAFYGGVMLAVVAYHDDLERLLERAGALPREEGIYLAFGYGLLDPALNDLNVAENRFIIIDPQGKVVVDQLEYGCTMAIRMYSAEIQVVETPYGKIGGVICCDADFPYVLHQASQKGVDILFVPTFEPTRENL